MPACQQARRPAGLPRTYVLAGVLPAAALGQGAGEALGRPPASVQQRATSGHRRVPFPEGGVSVSVSVHVRSDPSPMFHPSH